MKSRRYLKKSRKLRKSRKTRRGGVPAQPINELIQFRAYDDPPDSFNPNFATPDSMRAIFSLALIENMRRDDPDYNPLYNTDELDQPFKIHRIRGEVEEEIFSDEMSQWDNNKINDFLLGLQPGDVVKLTIA